MKEEKEKKLIISSNIKQIAGDINIASDVAEELDKKAKEILRKGVERAKSNQRKTLYARDL